MRMSKAASLGLLLLVCLASGGCGGEEDPEAPVLTAVAGSDRTVAKGSPVTLDGSDSEGAGSLTYEWALSGPDGSSAVLVRSDTAATSFTADREGVYEATLIVASGELTSTDSVVITAANTAPTGSAGPDVSVYTGSAVTLQGRGTDPTDDPIRFRWTIVSAPPGSAAVLDDPTSAAPTLTPDRDGEYEIELVVEDESLEASPDRVSVIGARLLDHSVVDAEYSASLARLVMASDAPSGLYIRDPADGAETFVALPTPPTSVSVGPDGTQAAVGHDGSVSHVSLTDGVVLDTFPVTTNAIDVVLAGNGYAYAMPREYGSDQIRCVNLSTGDETLAAGFGFYAEARAKLHPSGTFLYHANPSIVSPSDIAKWDISAGTAAYLYDSPYHGEYQGCGDLWISRDGERIFTRCGVVFQSSSTQAADMMFGGSLGGVDFILHLDQSAVASKVVVVPDVDANPFGDPSLAHSVRIYDDASLALERRIELLPVGAGEQAHLIDGRFAFVSADGARLFVIVEASAESSVDDFALLTYEL